MRQPSPTRRALRHRRMERSDSQLVLHSSLVNMRRGRARAIVADELNPDLPYDLAIIVDVTSQQASKALASLSQSIDRYLGTTGAGAGAGAGAGSGTGVGRDGTPSSATTANGSVLARVPVPSNRYRPSRVIGARPSWHGDEPRQRYGDDSTPVNVRGRVESDTSLSGTLPAAVAAAAPASTSTVRRALRKGTPVALEDLLEALVQQGLYVDVLRCVDESTKDRRPLAILLIEAPDEVLSAYSMIQWLKHGNIRDLKPFDETVLNRSWVRRWRQYFPDTKLSKPTSAERVEIVDRIVRHVAGVNQDIKNVTKVFPLHDDSVSHTNLRHYLKQSCVRTLRGNEEVVQAVRYTFGEGVAYYFAFSDFYVRMLVFVAIVGVALSIVFWFVSIDVYMLVMPYWSFFMSSVWPFVVLKQWRRRNTELEFTWGDQLNAALPTYTNPTFSGPYRRNKITGDLEPRLSKLRLWPKRLVLILVHTTLAIIMVVFIATMVTLYATQARANRVLMGIAMGFIVNFPISFLVSVIAKLFARWMNYPTEDRYFRFLVEQTLAFDLLLYVAWFLLVAVIYVVPGTGDYVTNILNFWFFGDPRNCCFGPYKQDHHCTSCPPAVFGTVSDPSQCVPCQGFFSFDAHIGVNLTFIVPAASMQAVNLLYAGLKACWQRSRRNRYSRKLAQRRQHATRAAQTAATAAATNRSSQSRVRSGDPHESVDLYDTQRATSSSDRGGVSGAILGGFFGLLGVDGGVEGILAEAQLSTYDQRHAFSELVLQFAMVCMFSSYFPLWPLLCLLLAVARSRLSAYSLAYTSQRPFPRKATGIGPYLALMRTAAYIAVVVNVLIVCFSTSVLEFYAPRCQGVAFHNSMRADYSCVGVGIRLFVALVAEHVILLIVIVLTREVSDVDPKTRLKVARKDYKFKRMITAIGDRSASSLGSSGTLATPGSRRMPFGSSDSLVPPEAEGDQQRLNASFVSSGSASPGPLMF